MNDNIFKAKTEQVNGSLQLTILEIDAFSQELLTYLDENIVPVCAGRYAEWTLDDIKTRLMRLFRNKQAKEGAAYSKWEMGAVAELFVHLYMHYIGIDQESMFFNLEENSVKKGFDGYYTDSLNHWIMESKSGSVRTAGISHSSKLREAFNDLEGKVSGSGTNNNPWLEAYNHARSMDINSADQIRLYLQQMARDFDQEIYSKIEEFNIIPCATLYFEDTEFIPVENIASNSRDALSGKSFKKAHLICVSNKSVDAFKAYIGISTQ